MRSIVSYIHVILCCRFDEVQLNRLMGVPVLLVRLKDSTGTWFCFKQICTTLFQNSNRQTLQAYLDNLPMSQREANPAEKDYLCAKGALKSRAKKILLVNLAAVCTLTQKLTGNQALVANISRLQSQSSHLLNGEDSLMLVPQDLATPSSQGVSPTSPLFRCNVQQPQQIN